VRLGAAAGALERLAIVLASLALSVGLIALLSGFFAGRDQAGVAGPTPGPGQAFRDLGHAILRPGQPRPRYDSDPPTSGAHVPEPARHNEARLNDDQILQALEVGDVVIVYGTRKTPPGLLAFARTVAPPFSPALAAAGQAVILVHRPGSPGITALAWARLLKANGLADPRLRQFVDYWLGRGAPPG
jgi:Protein of unknown function (DUF3105)